MAEGSYHARGQITLTTAVRFVWRARDSGVTPSAPLLAALDDLLESWCRRNACDEVIGQDLGVVAGRYPHARELS